MDQHPGDTFSARFLTFWGVLGAVAAAALLLGIYRWVAIPSSSAPNDGGAGETRAEVLRAVSGEQATEYNQVAEVEAGKTVRLPADAIIPYAVSVLKNQKAAPGPVKTPEAAAREQEEKAKAAHDPNLSKFEEE